MHLRTGVPLISDLKALQRDAIYRQHTEFNANFLRQHQPALAKYGRHWGTDPFKLWSRRWEYPFTAERVLAYAAERPGQPLHLLDAGSGVTYVPYLLCGRIHELTVTCCDYEAGYAEMFAKINETDRSAGRTGCVSFTRAMLQELPMADDSLDVVCCISVLEHTDNYDEILAEFARVLKPGGLLVLTFDLSLDGRFNLSRQQAENLLSGVTKRFEVPGGVNLEGELARMDTLDSGEPILSTDYVKTTEPELLPWKYPALKAAADLVKGHGWTGGFRSKSVFCLDARAKQG